MHPVVCTGIQIDHRFVTPKQAGEAKRGKIQYYIPVYRYWYRYTSERSFQQMMRSYVSYVHVSLRA